MDTGRGDFRRGRRVRGSARAAAYLSVGAVLAASLSGLAGVGVGVGVADAESGSLSTGTGSAGGQAGGSLASALLSPPDPRDTPFYTDPAELEGAPGRVLRTEPAPLNTEALGNALGEAGSAGSSDAAGLRTSAERVLYESTDAHDTPVATSGLYIRNDGAAPAGSGERPLAVISPGTQGPGDQCAPSKTMPQILDLQLSPGLSIGLGYEIIQAHFFLARGFSVFVPDFEGVGTPGQATYLDRAAMGHATLDGARAAAQLPESGLPEKPKTALYGHSQGGGATAAAAELAPDYAPDVDLVGAAASGVPADLLAVVEGFDGSVNAGLNGFVAAGLSATYPDQAERIRGLFNDTGTAMLDRMATSCTGDEIAAYAFADSRKWTKDGRTFAENLRSDPQLAPLVEEQRIGTLRPTAPVAVIQEPNDDVIPTPQAKQLAADWCGAGANVEYLEGFTPPILPSSSAVHAIGDLHPRGADWLADRVAGKAAATTCPA